MIYLTCLLSIVCAFALPLSEFISRIEDNMRCEKCTEKDKCFSRRKLTDKYNMVDQFMFVSFLVSFWKKDDCARCEMFFKRTVCVIITLVLSFFLIWSRRDDLTGVLYGVTTVSLCFLSVVDWNTQYIPLEMNGVIFVCGLIQLFADLSNWLEYAIGLIAVSGFLCIVNLIATPIMKKRYGGEQEISSGIGDGDIKLMAATGLLLGWKLNFIALGIGCIAGSVIHLILMLIKKGEHKLAFGPYLSLGVYITMICGEQLVSWYLSMIGVSLSINF